MPVLAYESYEEWQNIFEIINRESKEKALIVQSVDRGRYYRPSTPQSDKDSALIEGYISPPEDTRPLHCRRTLDQYSYYMLETTERRDRDQVTYRWAKRQKDTVSQGPTPILMVDQLWLWVLPDGISPLSKANRSAN